MQSRVTWCNDTDLKLNPSRTAEPVLDYYCRRVSLNRHQSGVGGEGEQHVASHYGVLLPCCTVELRVVQNISLSYGFCLHHSSNTVHLDLICSP